MRLFNRRPRRFRSSFPEVVPLHNPTDKNAIRIRTLALRQRVTPEDAEIAGRAVAAYLLPLIAEDAVVAGYHPVRGELDIYPTMMRLSDRGFRLCLPVIEAADKPLFFRRWQAGIVMEKGRYGIDIPPIGTPVLKPDVVIVPLVAFDRKGNRLGYGAGYYDRTLEKLREMQPFLQVIGVGYSVQEVEGFEAGIHDQKMDVIVTEKGVI